MLDSSKQFYVAPTGEVTFYLSENGVKTEEVRIIAEFTDRAVEENIRWGFGVVPCPNLYEYPIRSLHYNRFGIAWGNEQRDVDITPQPIKPNKWRNRKNKK